MTTDLLPPLVPRHGQGQLVRELRARGAWRVVQVDVDDGRSVRIATSSEGWWSLDLPWRFLFADAGTLDRLATSLVTNDVRMEMQPSHDGSPPVRPARIRTVKEEDVAVVVELHERFDRFNKEDFAGGLPRVPIYLCERMRKQMLGHYQWEMQQIVLSRNLVTDHDPASVNEILRHEMIHLWQHVQGGPIDHAAGFRNMARRLGIPARASTHIKRDRPQATRWIAALRADFREPPAPPASQIELFG